MTGMDAPMPRHTTSQACQWTQHTTTKVCVWWDRINAFQMEMDRAKDGSWPKSYRIPDSLEINSNIMVAAGIPVVAGLWSWIIITARARMEATTLV